MNDEKAKGWFYLDYMLSIFPIKRISKSIQELAKEKSIPLNVLNGIVKQFYEKHNKEMDGVEYVKTNKTGLKFAAYISVLFLLLNSLKCEIAPIFSALSIPEQE